MSVIAERIDRLSLGAKINLTVLVSCGVALGIAAGVHIAKEVIDFRPTLEAENRKLAQVVAANVSAAVLFDDAEAMNENLDAFSLIPEVYAAAIRDENGKVMASYVAEDRDRASGALEAELPGTFRIASPIIVRQERVGTLELVIGLDALDEAIHDYLFVAVLALICSLIPALSVIRILKPIVLKPLHFLSETMDRIAVTQDYDARVEQVVNDEFGDLARRFNAMLDEIQRRDQRLAQAAEEMTVAKEFAEAANATKTKFIANMSHELRTPLNAIIGYAEMVIEDLEDTGHDTQISDTRRILTAALHLLGLINDVLDVAKIEAGKLEIYLKRTDMRHLIEEAVESVRPAAVKNGNTMSCRIDDDVGITLIDEIRFRQCLLNLLSNACKFTKNGLIELHASVERSATGATLRIDVKDTGIGIEPEKLTTLFEPFVQIDSSMTRDQGGSGLGLAITRNILGLMSGSISVSSTPGEGSIFSLKVPCEANTELAEPVEDRSHFAADPALRTVLVIEDAEDSALLLARWLGPTGYHVVISGTGLEGLAAAKRLHPDLVILDVELPDITGWTLLEKLLDGGANPFIPVILLTVSEDRARALASGASELITKPVQKSRLIEIVAAHITAPPARVLLKVPRDRAAPVEAALEAAGHHVQRHEEDRPLPTEREMDAFDCVVIDASWLLRESGDAASNLNKINGASRDIILWCSHESAALVTRDLNHAVVQVTTSPSELLMAVRSTLMSVPDDKV